MEEPEEQIVMTPKKKMERSTTLMIERRPVSTSSQAGSNVHVAGGDHKGIVINKTTTGECYNDRTADLSLEFKVFLVSASTNKYTQESRQLCFWFKDSFPEIEHARSAQEFFKELVSPLEFPRDYVGFIKKIMKLMQHKYCHMKKVEVELTQLQESDKPPTRPISVDESVTETRIVVTEEKVLEMVESAYPNPITVGDMAREAHCDGEEILKYISELQNKGIIKAMDNGAFTRIVQNETEVKVVKQMPTMASSKQPTIAIITARYCEKLAVDAMIQNKETFVRYTTVGESNVYTLGNIGAHRVVSTKLPTVGHTREAMIATGNTTTRLLGTFQKVEFVFLVGVGGGVPHYTDYYKHVRLGDVVVSAPPDGQRFIYMYCEKANLREDDASIEFETKTWGPEKLVLQEIAAQMLIQAEANPNDAPWNVYLETGINQLLLQGFDFERPPADTDKLYMFIGGNDVIEVAHPLPPDSNSSLSQEGQPKIRLGPVASGRQLVSDDQMRQQFSAKWGILAFDSEFDAVVESVFGNRKESYIFIRGIADYKDGARRKEWQSYAALAASSFMKAIICGMEPPED